MAGANRPATKAKDVWVSAGFRLRAGGRLMWSSFAEVVVREKL